MFPCYPFPLESIIFLTNLFYSNSSAKVKYGVEKYDLEFRLRPDGGIELLDYYWTTETGERFVQCRREDIGYAAIPQQADQPNGGLEGDAHSGRLHFRMTAHQNDDQPIADPAHPEFVFEW